MAAPLTAFGITFIHMLVSGVIYPQELLPQSVASVGSYLPAAKAHMILFATFANYASTPTLSLLFSAAIMLFGVLLLSKKLRGRPQ